MKSVGYKKATQYKVINGRISVVLYNTKIVEHVPSSRHIVLQTGGYNTSMTKNRMNDYFTEQGLPLKVFADNGVWYCQNMQTGVTKAFANGLCIMGY
jgi:hypothetical protein